MNTVKCAITGVELEIHNAYRAKFLRQQLFDLIKSENPQITVNSYLDPKIVNDYRGKYLSNLIYQESGELNSVESKVVQSIQNNAILSEDLKPKVEGKQTFGN